MLAVHVVPLYARNDEAIVLMSHQGLAETWLGSWPTYLAYQRSDGFPHFCGETRSEHHTWFNHRRRFNLDYFGVSLTFLSDFLLLF